MHQQDFRPDNIPLAISRLRSDGRAPTVNQYFDGGQCRVFKADFSSGESWAVRVPLFTQDREAITSVVRGEADLLQELDAKGFRWAAKLQGYSATFDNAAGFPFIALTWMPGTPLSWSEDFPTRPLRDKILRQVALIQENLIECTKEPRVTATEHFERIIDNKVRRVRNGLLPRITEQDCVDQKNRLAGVLYPELVCAPFAMDHGDLSPQNILVDSNHNITGIIDWGFSAKVPVQMAAGIPRFLRLQRLVLPPSALLQKDRESYIASLGTRSSQAVSWMALVQSADDADFRHSFLESIISKGMHQRLEEEGWKLPCRDDPRAGDQKVGRAHLSLA